ncbi:TPA: hypothetical protein N0F65_011084 [Lagenidium giganteum]|uniref:Integrase catalytic domain-containing protein n=1 Tax=Lagenidium giganteum TaxID=4803 RepID=A0AAV2ZE81_9STRA|nr:TPA: hypothetical protein N0F65_011084 [Lagenidium giganteum]
MDAYSKYITVELLTSKSSAVVNPLIQRYISWAERQAGRSVEKIVQRELEIDIRTKYPVVQVLTDKGGEFVNREIDEWFASRGSGIEHIKVGPKSSHLNPCERVH